MSASKLSGKPDGLLWREWVPKIGLLPILRLGGGVGSNYPVHLTLQKLGQPAAVMGDLDHDVVWLT